MSIPSCRLLVLLAAASLVAPLCACTGDARRSRTGVAPAGDGAAPDRPQQPSGSAGEVSLTAEDLAPMDGYVKRRFWILGDDVEVVASREYFMPILSIAARIGLVKREDFEGVDEARSVLTFLGSPEQMDFSSAPRVMLGTGITITARKRIVLRFVRTTSADLPVRLRIAANGKARLGVGDAVHRKEESLVVGAQLRRAAGGGYQFEEQ